MNGENVCLRAFLDLTQIFDLDGRRSMLHALAEAGCSLISLFIDTELLWKLSHVPHCITWARGPVFLSCTNLSFIQIYTTQYAPRVPVYPHCCNIYCCSTVVTLYTHKTRWIIIQAKTRHSAFEHSGDEAVLYLYISVSVWPDLHYTGNRTLDVRP